MGCPHEYFKKVYFLLTTSFKLLREVKEIQYMIAIFENT